MLILEDKSEMSQCESVMEILPVSKVEEATMFLTKWGIPDCLVEKEAKYTGGTLVHLKSTVNIYLKDCDSSGKQELSDISKQMANHCNLGNKTLLQKCHEEIEARLLLVIKKLLYAKFVKKALNGLYSADGIVARKLLKELIINDSVDVSSLIEKEKDLKWIDVKETVKILTKSDLIRYDAIGCIRWHSPLIRSHLSDVERVIQLID